MSTYVNVPIDDLQIGDKVNKLGTLVANVTDHDTLEGYVVAMFERRGEETLFVRPSGTQVRVQVEDEERDIDLAGMNRPEEREDD